MCGLLNLAVWIDVILSGAFCLVKEWGRIGFQCKPVEGSYRAIKCTRSTGPGSAYGSINLGQSVRSKAVNPRPTLALNGNGCQVVNPTYQVRPPGDHNR